MAEKKKEAINLRGMIQLNQVEDLIGQILSKIQSQENEIQKLNEIVKQFAITDNVNKEVSDIHVALRKLNSRMDVLRDASSIRLDDKIVTSADMAYQNSLQIAAIQRLLPSFAESSHILQLIEDIYKNYDPLFEELDQKYTHITLTQQLQQTILENTQKISRLEESISKKLERTEIKHIERLFTELNGYKKIFEDLSQKYLQLDDQLEEFNQHINKQLDSLHSHIDQTTNTLEIQFQNDDQKILQQLQTFKQQTQAFQTQIPNKYATIKTQSDILNMIETFQKLFKDLEIETKQLKDDQRNFEKVLPLKADLTEVQRIYVRKDVFGDVLRSLGEEMDRKGLQEDILNHSQKLEVLNTSLNHHDTQIQVALRFVEWFTQRGDVYEYNVKVIDKHLQNLATSSIAPPTIPTKFIPGKNSVDSIMKRNLANYTNPKNPSQKYSSKEKKRKKKGWIVNYLLNEDLSQNIPCVSLPTHFSSFTTISSQCIS